MNLHDFISSTSQLHPPEEISVYLTSLWHDAKGNWEKAHDVIQELEDKTASWIHAYLHRKEGDLWNADYWYSKAGRKRPNVSLEEEWKDISASVISNNR